MTILTFNLQHDVAGSLMQHLSITHFKQRMLISGRIKILSTATEQLADRTLWRYTTLKL
jgi:hypothetical protein